MSSKCDNHNCCLRSTGGICQLEQVLQGIEEFNCYLCDLYIDPNEDNSQPGVQQRHRERLDQAIHGE